jgi:lipoprotein NlpI
MNYLGLHYVETGNYAAARTCFERALRLEWRENDTARNYLAIVNNRLLEAAEGGLGAKLRNPAP